MIICFFFFLPFESRCFFVFFCFIKMYMYMCVCIYIYIIVLDQGQCQVRALTNESRPVVESSCVLVIMCSLKLILTTCTPRPRRGPLV